MGHIFQGRSAIELLYVEIPPLAAALLVAESFFKFGSFSLEAIAFLGVWYAVAVPYAKAIALIGRGRR